MSPADIAKEAALAFECKKDSMRQNQSGDWRITFTVKSMDLPRSFTEAMPGTRYQAVIVEIGPDEQPINRDQEASPAHPPVAKPDRVTQPRPDRAKRDGVIVNPRTGPRNWRDMMPSQQAGMRCDEFAFTTFLKEQRADDWHEAPDAVECVYLICGIESRSELSQKENIGAREKWRQLDDQYQAWMRIGA